MASIDILRSVSEYLEALNRVGIHPSRAILFGFQARDGGDEGSDIDVVVVAPELEPPRSLEIVERLWLATEWADDRIEPVACGEREWQENGARPILEIARREGIAVPASKVGT